MATKPQEADRLSSALTGPDSEAETNLNRMHRTQEVMWQSAVVMVCIGVAVVLCVGTVVWRSWTNG